MKLIADSGSSKTAWYAMSEPSTPIREFTIHTRGINPVRDDEEDIRAVLTHALEQIEAEGRSDGNAFGAADVTAVHFYGAGCLPSRIPLMARLLSACFPAARVQVASDLLGAARALCGHQEGIACILGTGSNSCLYDGRDIVSNVPALGWILGDEGSGAVLGRTLVSDLLKGQLPAALRDAFFEEYGMDQDDIIDRVYRGPMPNRWLAGLVPFIVARRSEPAVHDMLTTAFVRFFRRNVSAYGRPDLPVGFVGGVASQFEAELRSAAAAEGFVVGQILKQPIDEMVRYHREG